VGLVGTYTTIVVIVIVVSSGSRGASNNVPLRGWFRPLGTTARPNKLFEEDVDVDEY
jgi:hypothetical protein